MKPHGLPKTSLIRKNREFNRVYRYGNRLYGDGFAVIYMSNQKQWSRLGISVQRKVGGAVQRNRIKRVIREVFRKNRHLFPQNADVVVTVRPGFAARSFNDFQHMVSAVMDAKFFPNDVNDGELC